MTRFSSITAALLAVLILSPHTALGQRGDEPALFREGMAAYDAGDFETAAARFDSVVAATAIWTDSHSGAAAFWLGESLLKAGRAAEAPEAWRRGIDAMQEVGSMDIRLVDEYLRYLLGDADRLEGDMSLALDLYVNLLYNVDALLEDEEQRRLGRHIAQLSLVAPAGVLDDAILGDALTGTWAPRSGAGPLLVAWWRSQDPLPATRANERLEEHLRRLAHVGSNYPDAEAPAGVDTRGELYLRYGPPEEKIEVTFDDPVLTDIIFSPGVTVNLSDFPENEFWVFGHIDRVAWFLFVKRNGRFELAETMDLVPTPLQSGFSGGPRGRIKAGMTIAVLQNIFRQLAPLHPDFAMRYAEVDAYAMQMPEFGPGRVARRTSTSLANPPGAVDGSNQAEQPRQFIQTMLVKSRSEDDASIARREAHAPRVYTDALPEVGTLWVGYRAVRYLEPDGSTRTVIHWSPEPGGLRPGRGERELMREMAYEDSGRYLITLTAAQKDADYIDRVIHRDRFLVTELPARDEAIPVQQTTMTGDTDTFNVALQWDQFAMGASRTRRGPRIRVGTARMDSVAALNANPRVLEMSDLLPMTALLDVDPVDFVPTPYPFQVLTRDVQLGLSFEIYHLDYGTDDQTHYTVSFDVRRNERRGGLLSFRGREESTSASFGGTGSSRRATEMILIDLQSWEGSGELDIVVTVTDNVSNRTVSRTVSFDLQ